MEVVPVRRSWASTTSCDRTPQRCILFKGTGPNGSPNVFVSILCALITYAMKIKLILHNTLGIAKNWPRFPRSGGKRTHLRFFAVQNLS